MSTENLTPTEVAGEDSPAMSIFERYLTVWVGACIVVGIGLGHFVPGLFQALGSMEVARVNLPVAALIWLMIIPMLIKIDFAALHQVRRHWRGIGVTLFVNWAVKPFSMAFLGWLFIATLFRDWLPADQIDAYLAGLILLVAMIGAIVLTLRHKPNVKRQSIVDQVGRTPAMSVEVRKVESGKGI